jgi:capsule polysaccharide export protein KpsC/LpsZ
MCSKPWQDVVRQKRETRERLIKPYLGAIDGERSNAETLTEIDSVEGITTLLASGKVSAHDVAKSYILRYGD